MGIYDTYYAPDGPAVQLKVGDYRMLEYPVGADVPIGDGIYVSKVERGAVVIYDGRLVAVFLEAYRDFLFDKYGNTWNPKP